MTAIEIRSNLTDVEPDTILSSKETADVWLVFTHLVGIGSHKMLWTCDETGESYSSPIDEPLNKPLQCLCCGKTHALTPGKLDEKDEKLIQQARDTALANPDLYEDFTLAWTGKKHGNGSNPW